MSEKEDPSNIDQMVGLLSARISGINGLDCLRMIDSLYVKQYTSLTEGYLLKINIIFILFIFIIQVICGVASESKFDIFNDKNERILQAFESKPISFLLCICLYLKSFDILSTFLLCNKKTFYTSHS
jgi:hypothetical protein